MVIGDQNQLQPFTHVDDRTSPARGGGGAAGAGERQRGFFQRVERALRGAGQGMAMLETQYRMHAALCAFVSAAFYQVDPTLIGGSTRALLYIGEQTADRRASLIACALRASASRRVPGTVSVDRARSWFARRARLQLARAYHRVHMCAERACIAAAPVPSATPFDFWA